MTSTKQTTTPSLLRSTLFRSLLSAAALLIVTIGTVGCDSGGTSEPDEVPTAEARFLHASAGAGALTVVADGDEIVSGLSFRRDFADPSITNYKEGIPVDEAIEVQDASGTVLTSVDAGQLEADAQYTVIVAGSMAEGDNAPQAVVLPDDRPELGSNEVGIRFVHSAAAAPSVDLFQVPSGDSVRTENRIAADVAFSETVPESGSFSVRTVPDSGFAWTVPTSAGPVRFPVGIPGQASLSPGRYATAVAVDTEEGAGFPVAGIVQVD